MTECEIVRGRFDRLHEGELTGDERRLVADHLGSDCDACAAWLAEVDAGAILEALAGDDAVLSDLERQRMLSVVLPEAPRRRRRWLAPSLGLVATAAAAVLLMARPGRQEAWTGEKGAVASPVALVVRPIVGTLAAGQPRVLRDWSDGEALAAGELLLFRIDVDRPAYVHLVAGEGRVLFVSGAPLPPGDHELTAGGQVLALDPRGHAGLLWIAAPERLEPAALAALQQGSAGDRATLCPSCGVVELRVGAP